MSAILSLPFCVYFFKKQTSPDRNRYPATGVVCGRAGLCRLVVDWLRLVAVGCAILRGQRQNPLPGLASRLELKRITRACVFFCAAQQYPQFQLWRAGQGTFGAPVSFGSPVRQPCPVRHQRLASMVTINQNRRITSWATSPTLPLPRLSACNKANLSPRH